MLEQEKINILLVDDRYENLVSLSAILDSPEYNLVMAESGSAALKLLLDQEFALILLDVHMPIVDGFETANLIKKIDKSKHIPIIFVTALNLEAPYLFKGYSVGAVDYIVKPIDPTILRSKVSVFAELYKKTKQLEMQSTILRKHDHLKREREIEKIELASIKREQKINEKYRDLVDGIKDGIVWITDLHSLNFSFISAQANRIMSIPYYCELPIATSSNSNMDKIPSFATQLIECPEFIANRKIIIDSLENGNSPARDFSFEHKVIKMDNTAIWFQTGVKLAESTDAKAHNFELRGISVDITKIKKAQEEAQNAICIRDQFLSIASHELKTPLTPLCLQLEILQKMAKSGASADSIAQKLSLCMDRLHRQLDRITHLIDGLLDVSRINSGKFVLERENTPLSELVQEVCDRFNEDVRRSGSCLRLHLSPDIVGLWDRMRIEQVVTNILCNAIKYGDGNPIEVSTYLDSKLDAAILSIRDRGIGIKSQDQERIFQVYERAVSSRHSGGLGLGLYIVRQIIEAHGGSIDLKSEYKKGSIFTIRLPLKPIACEAVAASCQNSVLEVKQPSYSTELLH